MAESVHSAQSIVSLLGAHPATLLGLELDADDDAVLGVWLVLSILLGGRTPEPVALDAWRRLASKGLSTPEAIVQAGPAAIEACLEEASLTKSEATTAVVMRVSRALGLRFGGSIDRLAADSENLEDLAGRLAGLGTGFGRAAVFRFLTPLRDRWTTANDLPASPAVCGAACCDAFEIS